jgi:hypothetical protein
MNSGTYFCLFIVVSALATVDAKRNHGDLLARKAAATRACGDGHFCLGVGGSEKCNDHCKSSESNGGCGAKRGDCGGIGWQTCQCFYSTHKHSFDLSRK